GATCPQESPRVASLEAVRLEQFLCRACEYRLPGFGGPPNYLRHEGLRGPPPDRSRVRQLGRPGGVPRGDQIGRNVGDRPGYGRKVHLKHERIRIVVIATLRGDER